METDAAASVVWRGAHEGPQRQGAVRECCADELAWRKRGCMALSSTSHELQRLSADEARQSPLTTNATRGTEQRTWQSKSQDRLLQAVLCWCQLGQISAACKS